MFKIDGPFSRVMNWVTRLLYLQVLWVLFTLVGLVVGGIFPATFAMFGMTRKWIREGTEFQLFPAFKEMYRASFFQTNGLGWWMVLLAFSLGYYFTITSAMGGAFGLLSIVLLISVSLVAGMTSLFIIPVYVHYDVRLLQVIRHAVIIAMTHPLNVIGLLITVIVFYYLFLLIPGVFVLVGVSSFAVVSMLIANRAFMRVERKLSNV